MMKKLGDQPFFFSVLMSFIAVVIAVALFLISLSEPAQRVDYGETGAPAIAEPAR